MDDFYILSEPESTPKIPEYWSYSQLEEWRTCPKKWWLLRAKYPNIEGEYPRPFTVPMIDGIILHKTLENFSRYVYSSTNEALSSFKLRNTINSELKEFLEFENSINPRFKKAYLKSRFCIDDCINNFKRIITQVENVFINNLEYQYNASRTPNTRVPVKGHEVYIAVDSPPIRGRIDFIDHGRIIDFKSGLPDDSYKNQLLFYALLFWLKTGQLPSSLEVIYSKHTSISYHELLNIETLTRVRDDLVEEIQNIESNICLGAPKANIQIDRCGHCPCRQNCDEYWCCLNNMNRIIKMGTGKIEPFWADVEIIKLPESWQGSGTCSGKGKSLLWGDMYLNIDSDKCPDRKLNNCPVGAKILGALIRYENGRWNLRTERLTEVFWIL